MKVVPKTTVDNEDIGEDGTDDDDVNIEYHGVSRNDADARVVDADNVVVVW